MSLPASSAPTLPEHYGPGPEPDARTRRQLYLYLLPLVAFPVLLLAAAFLIIPTQWFNTHTGSTYLANLGYARTLHGADCQVLVYGDSTAMVGVRPAVITAKTGLTACNIAEFEGMTQVTGTLLVDRFLENNPRPRFLVFLYAPEDLNPSVGWNGVSTFEATSYIVEHEHTAATLKALLTHPGPVFDWAAQGTRQAMLNARNKGLSEETMTLRARNGGQMPIKTEKTLPCDDTRREVRPQAAWMKGLRRKYAVGGTEVLIDATPTIPCDPSLRYFQLTTHGLIDNQPYAPITADSYTDDGRLHANALGAERISTMIADQVAARMQGGR